MSLLYWISWRFLLLPLFYGVFFCVRVLVFLALYELSLLG